MAREPSCWQAGGIHLSRGVSIVIKGMPEKGFLKLVSFPQGRVAKRRWVTPPDIPISKETES